MESSLLLNGPLSNANNSTTESRIANLLSGEGSSKLSPLAVGNNGGGKMSCCFFGDILKFYSPLAYISIHYRSIGRQVTKTHTVLERHFGSSLVCRWRWNGQIRATKNYTTNRLSVDATSFNWGTTSYESLKIRWPRKCRVTEAWKLNLRVVWSSQF